MGPFHFEAYGHDCWNLDPHLNGGYRNRGLGTCNRVVDPMSERRNQWAKTNRSAVLALEQIELELAGVATRQQQLLAAKAALESVLASPWPILEAPAQEAILGGDFTPENMTLSIGLEPWTEPILNAESWNRRLSHQDMVDVQKCHDGKCVGAKCPRKKHTQAPAQEKNDG